MFALGLIPTLVAAQTDATAKISQIAATNSLDGKGIKPWHLKVSFLTMDAKSAPMGSGTVEEWWSAPDRWRQEFTTDGHTSVSVKTPEGLFHSAAFIPPSWDVELMLNQIIHPVDEDDVREAHPEVREQQFGKANLECVMLSQPIKGVMTAPLGLFPTYCAEGDKLRLTWLSTNINVVTQQMGTFQAQTVATKIQVSVHRKMVLEGKVDQLTTYAPEDGKFETADLTKGLSNSVQIGPDVMVGNRISGPSPVYPASARQSRISGTVVMKAKIGTDGRIHALQVMSSPDGDLALAALIAVQQWEYTPFLLNGIPTEVTTTITVHFHLS